MIKGAPGRDTKRKLVSINRRLDEASSARRQLEAQVARSDVFLRRARSGQPEASSCWPPGGRYKVSIKHPKQSPESNKAAARSLGISGPTWPQLIARVRVDQTAVDSARPTTLLEEEQPLSHPTGWRQINHWLSVTSTNFCLSSEPNMADPETPSADMRRDKRRLYGAPLMIRS